MKRLRNPILFQGRRKKSDYFEGWYYKNVSLEHKTTVAFIPGISLNKEDPHSFIQVIKSNPIETDYYRYEVEEFEFKDRPFKIKIGENIFSEKSLKVDLESQGRSIKGRIDFSGNQKIQSSLLCPSIMGFFAYIPNMECNHGIISMNHSLSGRLNYHGMELNFDGGKGYIEKDWGRSFPSEYIWVQTNNFKDDRDSFMMSIAKIPFMGFEFNGLIANLHYDGREYRFATYNRAKISTIEVAEKSFKVKVKRGSYTLLVNASVEDVGKLKSPNQGSMVDSIKEGLSGRLELELREGEELVAEIRSEYAAIEISGYFD